MAQPLTPAAQYLRMSTEHQQYSLTNQATAISRYAADHGFLVVKTYSDAAKSGLRIKNRNGLKQLLKNVVDGGSEFRAILVYDVSRWGRFQDVDEAAHYEYLCKSAGVPVHYCEETFACDTSMPGLIMKTLKRVMAGEYSRDLSVKVKAGLTHLARLGYKLGGPPAYGLRRLLLDTKGNPRQLLAFGERKSLTTEHVTLVPGPITEVATIRRIFHEFAVERRSMRSIANRLGAEGVPPIKRAPWDAGAITRILRHPHYIGMQVWGKTTAYLNGPVKRLSPEHWVTRPNAFEPIISKELFDRTQAIFAGFTHNLSNEELLDRLKVVLNEHGKLTADIIDQSRLCPGASAYYKRFGNLLNVYARLGYSRPELLPTISSRARLAMLRRDLIDSIVRAFQGEIQEFRVNRRHRAILRWRKTGLKISPPHTTMSMSACFFRGPATFRLCVPCPALATGRCWKRE